MAREGRVGGSLLLGDVRILGLWRHPVGLPALALVGFGLGVGVLAVGAKATGPSARFVQTDAFRVWAAVIGVQTAFWMAVAGPLWTDLANDWREAGPGRVTVAATTGVVAAFLAALLVASPVAGLDWPLWGHQVKTTVLTLLGALLVGLPALAGIGLVHQRVRERRDRVAADDIAVLVGIRGEGLRYLFEAGTVISLAVVAAGALRQATVGGGFLEDAQLPAVGVLAYGAFFTLLLGLVYVPTHLALKRFAMTLVEHHFPLDQLPEPTGDDFTSWLERRAALEGLLQVKVSVVKQLETSLFIFAPLLSAVLTHYVSLAAAG